MRTAKALRALMPPIAWTAAEYIRAFLGGARRTAARGRDITAMSSDERFSVDLKRVTLPSGVYFVPKYAAHRPASRAIMKGELFEPQTHSFIGRMLDARPGNLVHAGTFFGDMLPSFSRMCPRTVYAFEPVLESYVLAKLCVQANDLANVVLLNAGLGSAIRSAKIDTGDADGIHRGGSAQIGDRGQFTALMTIDALGLDDLSIIQLDVEGHELEALRGATETIRRNSPIVMIEDNAQACDGFLRDLGYVLGGEIPGLSVWAPSDRVAETKRALAAVKAGSV